MKKRKLEYRKTVTQSGIPIVFKIIMILLCLSTLLNNARVSESTKNRDNISATWEAITSDKDFLSTVKDKDLFISTTYNDSYQINVADFYLRSGIRLAAFLWPGYVWKDYDSCSDYSKCKLTNPVGNITTWLTNISKGDSWLRFLSRTWRFTNDWPNEIRISNGLVESQFWYFNIYMITPDVGLAYLIPVVKMSDNLLANPNMAKVSLISLKEETTIKPSLFGNCMVPSTTSRLVQTSYGKVTLSNWKIDESERVLDLVDLRTISTGTC